MTAVSLPIQVGLNPYAELVQEDAAGRRRVLVGGVWRSEATLAPARACRARSAADAHLAMQSMAVAEVSAAFGHRPARAYAVWSAASGRPVDLSEGALKSIEQSSSPAWRAFRKGSAVAMGERGLALRHSGSLVPVPQWERVLAAPGPGGFPLGVAIGLSDRLPEDWRTLSDTHSWSLPSAAFGKKANWPPGAVAWWPKDPGQALRWRKEAEQRLPMCWVLPDTAAERVLDMPAARLVSRTEIRHGTSLVAIVLRTDPAPPSKSERVSISLRQWSGEPPRVEPNVLPVEPDAFGRVPYRACSRTTEPEAVAPLRLEAAMHAALRDVCRQHPDLDAWVAQGLGVEPGRLSAHLSCEQVDAVALARARLEEGAALIIADDAGFGKGRMLASLALMGLAQGRTVVMVTENAGLFSDFYRDLCDVSPQSPPVPQALHADARILDRQGQLVVRGLSPLPDPNTGPGLVLTTYGQLATDPKKEKAAWLRARMGSNAWCLFDEAHNAAGEAVVFDAIDAVASASAGTVFASATFARSEQNLALYRRALGVSEATLSRIRHALQGDDGLLRQVLVEQMARAGRLVRREHPAIPPPPVSWVDADAPLLDAMSAFEAFWQALFSASEAWEQAQGGRAQIAWLRLGGWLSRTVREFAMLAKTPALVDWIQSRLRENAKVVVAADLTMEAALKDGLGLGSGKKRSQRPIETEDGTEEHLPGNGIYWRDRLRALLDLVVPAPAMVPAPGSHLARVIECRAAANKALDQLPAWTLSPIDTLRHALQGQGVASAELSGRQHALSAGEPPMPTRRGKVDRQQQVRDFNAGEVDVAVLTRAGSTGISLHAGARFKDQRKRYLVEWGVAADTVARIQFWGRVRRRDQVCEPGYASLALDTPYERRLRAREERKRLRLASLTGHGRIFEPEEVGPEGEALVAEWADDRPRAARRIGVHEPLGEVGQRVERALVRALVLPEAEQAALVSRLDRGLALAADQARLSRSDSLSTISRTVRSAYWFGPAGPADRLGSWRVDLVERTYAPDPQASSVQVVQELKKQRSRADLLSGGQVLERWRQVWSQEPGSEYRNHVWGRILDLLPRMHPGRGVIATHPATGAPARGLILGLTAPEAQPRPVAASVFAPSQVGVEMFLVGMLAPITLPLSTLLSDPALQVSDKPAEPDWFDQQPSPWVACGFEGDPMAATLLGRRLGVGRLVLAMDESGAERTVWRFPSALSKEQIWSWPRDLAGIEQARRFWRAHPDAAIHLALPLGSHGKMEPVDKGVWLEFDEASETLFQAHWLQPQHRQKIGHPVRRTDASGKAVWRRFIAFGDILRLMLSWEGAGHGFRIDAAYATWLEKDNGA